MDYEQIELQRRVTDADGEVGPWQVHMSWTPEYFRNNQMTVISTFLSYKVDMAEQVKKLHHHNPTSDFNVEVRLVRIKHTIVSEYKPELNF